MNNQNAPQEQKEEKDKELKVEEQKRGRSNIGIEIGEEVMGAKQEQISTEKKNEEETSKKNGKKSVIINADDKNKGSKYLYHENIGKMGKPHTLIAYI
jgi:hypothetical protein